jgi:hypothetical protein
LKKIYSLLFVVLILSCNKKVKIKITKLEGSPSYENARLSLDTIYQEDKNNFMFSLGVDNFKLGEQTKKDFDFKLANSEKDQTQSLKLSTPRENMKLFLSSW